MKKYRKRLHKELDQFGLLLLSDSSLPSLTAIVAGKPIKGSWWGHPQGNLMYNLSNELMDSPNILTLKLINKKITFVDQRHWDSIFAIALAGQKWQTEKLSPDAKKLLKIVQLKGSLRADDDNLKQSPTEIGKIASQLEERLLLYSESIHTDSGKHIRVLSSWDEVVRTRQRKKIVISVDDGINSFETLREKMEEKYEAKVKFPWSSSTSQTLKTLA